MASVNHEDIEEKLNEMHINSDTNSTEAEINNVDGGPGGRVTVGKELQPSSIIPSLTGVYDESYSSHYKERGYCVIFNHKRFHRSLQMNERSGTDQDRNRASKLFKELGFKVEVYEDLGVKDVKEKLNYYAYQVDHLNCDCFVMVFMSHGEEGQLYGFDSIFKAEDLFSNFTADNCPSLAGKPKMFFIQACRGDGLDAGVEMYTRTVDQTDNGMLSMYKIPNHADFLVCWSTVPGYYSWRNTTNGSWFIQSLVKVFERFCDSLDVLAMMTNVNRFMINNFESNCPASTKMHGKKQSACIVSTLMRHVYLKPKI